MTTATAALDIRRDSRRALLSIFLLAAVGPVWADTVLWKTETEAKRMLSQMRQNRPQERREPSPRLKQFLKKEPLDEVVLHGHWKLIRVSGPAGQDLRHEEDTLVFIGRHKSGAESSYFYSKLGIPGRCYIGRPWVDASPDSACAIADNTLAFTVQRRGSFERKENYREHVLLAPSVLFGEKAHYGVAADKVAVEVFHRYAAECHLARADRLLCGMRYEKVTREEVETIFYPPAGDGFINMPGRKKEKRAPVRDVTEYYQEFVRVPNPFEGMPGPLDSRVKDGGSPWDVLRGLYERGTPAGLEEFRRPRYGFCVDNVQVAHLDPLPGEMGAVVGILEEGRLRQIRAPMLGGHAAYKWHWSDLFLDNGAPTQKIWTRVDESVSNERVFNPATSGEAGLFENPTDGHGLSFRQVDGYLVSLETWKTLSRVCYFFGDIPARSP